MWKGGYHTRRKENEADAGQPPGSQLRHTPKVEMPFYELLCISAHQPQFVRSRSVVTARLESLTGVFLQSHIRNLVRTSALHVLDAGGVVRDLRYMGTRTLPQKMKRAGPNRLGE